MEITYTSEWEQMILSIHTQAKLGIVFAPRKEEKVRFRDTQTYDKNTIHLPLEKILFCISPILQHAFFLKIKNFKDNNCSSSEHNGRIPILPAEFGHMGKIHTIPTGQQGQRKKKRGYHG